MSDIGVLLDEVPELAGPDGVVPGSPTALRMALGILVQARNAAKSAGNDAEADRLWRRIEDVREQMRRLMRGQTAEEAETGIETDGAEREGSDMAVSADKVVCRKCGTKLVEGKNWPGPVGTVLRFVCTECRKPAAPKQAVAPRAARTDGQQSPQTAVQGPATSPTAYTMVLTDLRDRRDRLTAAIEALERAAS